MLKRSAALALALLFAFALPGIAIATAPFSNGLYVVCRVNVSESGIEPDSSFTFWASCTSTYAVTSGSGNGIKFRVPSHQPSLTSFDIGGTGDVTSAGSSGSVFHSRATATTTIPHGVPAGSTIESPVGTGTTYGYKDGCQFVVPSPPGCFDASNEGAVVSFSTGSGYPSYPADDGTFTAEPDPEAKCWVDLSAGNGSWVAKFGSRADPGAQSDDSYAWTFGDSGTSSTQNPTHEYASATDSGSKWTAGVVVTRPAAIHDQSTCSVQFDFNGPSHVDGDTGSTGTGDSSDNCSAFDLPCWLRKLFVPSGSALGDEFGSLRTAAESKWPVGPVTWVSDQANGVRTAIDSSSGDSTYGRTTSDEGCSYGHLSLPLLPSGSGTPSPLFVPIFPSGCGGHSYDGQAAQDTSNVLDPVRTATYALTTLACIWLMVKGVRRGVAIAMNEGDPGGSE